MGFSNKFLGLWNIITFLLSLPIIGVGIWLASKHGTKSACFSFLPWPVIILGVLLLVISVLGFVGSCWAVSCLLWIYLTLNFVLILLLGFFTVFGFVITSKGADRALTGKGFEDYVLGGHSTWLQTQLNKNSNWNRVQSCLSNVKVCNQLDNRYPTMQQFSAANLSPLESGCCKPPMSCGFIFINVTQWDTSLGSATDSDCKAWSNDANVFCFHCNSCKAGMLQTLKLDWRIPGLILACTSVILLITYYAGCCVLRNARRPRYYV